MKNPILLGFVLISSITFAQTRELQQSIDSFRTVLNQQNAYIKQLQLQVRKLNVLVSTLKSDLNTVPEFANAEKLKQNSADSSLMTVKPKTRLTKIQPKVVIEQPQQFGKRLSPIKIKKLIRESKLIKIVGNRKYYKDKYNRIFYVEANNKKGFYVK